MPVFVFIRSTPEEVLQMPDTEIAQRFEAIFCNVDFGIRYCFPFVYSILWDNGHAEVPASCVIPRLRDKAADQWHRLNGTYREWSDARRARGQLLLPDVLFPSLPGAPHQAGDIERRVKPLYITRLRRIPGTAVSVAADPLAVWFYYVAYAFPTVIVMLISWGAVERAIALIRWFVRHVA